MAGLSAVGANYVVPQVRKTTNAATIPLENKEEKKSALTNNQKGLLALSLLALAGTGVYLLTRGRKGKISDVEGLKPTAEAKEIISNVKPEIVTDTAKEIEAKINSLKASIKSIYQQKKASIIQELSKSHNLAVRNIALGKPNEKNSVISEMSCFKSEMRDLSKNARDKFKGKNVLVEGKEVFQQGLLDDADYLLCRKLRRQLVKDFHNQKFDNMSKLPLVNEVIFAKLNGRQTLANSKMPISQAMNLVKDSSKTNNDINRHLLEKGYYINGSVCPFNNSVTPISINMVNSNFGVTLSNYKRIPAYQTTLDKAAILKDQIKQQVKSLAQKMRNSEEAIELKNLVAQKKTIVS